MELQTSLLSGDNAGRVCFTGHRVLPTDGRGAIESELSRIVQTLVSRGYTTFYSGGAVGFDLLAAETVLAAAEHNGNVRLILALPCKNHDRAWSEDDRRRLSEIISRAAEVVYVSEAYSERCMRLRNRYMVDRSEIVIAYFSGNPRTGTGSTVKYAEDTGREVLVCKCATED